MLKIVNKANMSVGFSILADETADISGKEQLSLGVRYVTEDGLVKEAFLGFTVIENFDAKGIASCILKKCNEVKLNLDKPLGQGYDGCSVMAGKECGVKAIIPTKYPKAIFVHCASHRLNLVINDLNAIAYIRNSIATI